MKKGCVVVTKGNEEKLTGAVITDARASDELVIKLLVKNYEKPKSDFLTVMENFYRVGVERKFISESGDILDQDVYDWYYATLFENFIAKDDIDPIALRLQVENLLSCFGY